MNEWINKWMNDLRIALTSRQANEANQAMEWLSVKFIARFSHGFDEMSLINKPTTREIPTRNTQKNYHVLNTHNVNLFAFPIIDRRKENIISTLFKEKSFCFETKKCRIYLRWASRKSFAIDTQNESTLKAVFNNHFTLSKIHFNATFACVSHEYHERYGT